MARGQSSISSGQLDTTNKIGAGAIDRSKKQQDELTPGYTSLMDTGYLNPEEEHAAVTSEMGAATQPFQTQDFNASNRAASTRNASDLTAQQDQLALDQGRTAGDAAANLQKEKMANQQAGMYGLSHQADQSQQLGESMYGLGPSTLQARAAGKSGDELGMDYASLALGTKMGGKV